MDILSVLLFFLYTWGLGFSATSFLNESDSFLERNFTRIGAGLAVIPLLGILLSLLRVPVDWKAFLPLSLAYPVYYTFRNYGNFRFNLNLKIKKSDLSMIFVLIIFLLSFYMYYKGSFAYPYLEDDDSWSHAIGAKYVSMEKTFFNPSGKIHYLDPYPPVYDGIMGLMGQTSDSLMWTLKFFNALVISLSIIFFYLLVKELSSDTAVSLSSTIALAMIPAYLSHFIWAHAFIPGFIFLSFLFLERTRHDRKWMYLAALAIAALVLTSFTQAIKYAMLFLIYLAAKSLSKKQLMTNILIAGILGFIITLLWWIPLLIRYGDVLSLMKGLGFAQSVLDVPLGLFNNPLFYAALMSIIVLTAALFYFAKKKLSTMTKSYLGMSFAVLILISYVIVYSHVYEIGTADRIYDFNDFFIAQKQNMINNPVGIGIAAMLLTFMAFFFMIHEQHSAIKNKKDEIPESRYKILNILLTATGILLLISLISFASFRLRPGTFLRQWKLSPQDFSYLHSFSFRNWGIYLLVGSLIAIAAIYIYLIYKEYMPKQKAWIPISLLWFAYAFAGIFDVPTQLFTFRVWMLLAFTLSIVVGYSFVSILSMAKNSGIPSIALWIALVFLLIFTSGMQKYAVNTAVWPPGAFWTSNEELQGYIWLKDNIPSGTKVFTFSNNAAIIGFDKFVCHWCSDVQEYQKIGFNESVGQNHDWLKKSQYEYLVIDGQTARKFGLNQTSIKVQELANSNDFKPVFNVKGGFILFKVV